MHILSWLWILALACPAGTVAQTDSNGDLDHYLVSHYKDKVLLLRNFYFTDELKFDSTGASIGQPRSGLWTVSGIVQIDNIAVTRSGIDIKAKRLVLTTDIEGKINYTTSRRAASITIVTDQQDLSPGKVDSLIAKVFLTDQDRFEKLVPAFWKECIDAATSGTQDEKKQYCKFSQRFSALPGVHVDLNRPTAPAVEETFNGVPILALSGKTPGISPPQATYTPEPQYSSDAREARIQAVGILTTVVGQDGLPRKISVRRPVGYGLDEMAVAAIATWKFTPAKKDGQPVPVKISIEIDFRL